MIIKPEFPVVLCHGLFGTHRYGFGPLAAGDYFRGIKRELIKAGIRLDTPRVHPTAGVYRRAWKLAERINQKFGDQPIHLIGHSMGGLDCRLLATDPAWAKRIISITTLGTPHVGTCLADMATNNLRLLLTGLEFIGLDVDGIHQVSTRHVDRLTADWADPPRTVCMSIAGNPEPHQTFIGMRPTQSWIFNREGPNDGLVPMESALGWGEPLSPWPIDHLSQINWGTPRRIVPTLYSSYFQLMKRLAEVESEFSTNLSVGFRTKDLVGV